MRDWNDFDNIFDRIMFLICQLADLAIVIVRQLKIESIENRKIAQYCIQLFNTDSKQWNDQHEVCLDFIIFLKNRLIDLFGIIA